MPASDLFSSSSDAHFRLYNTHIVIGRAAAHVIDVQRGDDKDTPEAAIIHLRFNKTDRCKVVQMGMLPLRAMTDCPSGYVDEKWVSRGPVRHRYQGLTMGSFWFRDAFGGIEQNDVLDVPRMLEALLPQRRQKAKSTSIRLGKPLTNRILVTRDKLVLACGEAIGEYAGQSRIKLLPGIRGRMVGADLSAADLKIIT